MCVGTLCICCIATSSILGRYIHFGKEEDGFVNTGMCIVEKIVVQLEMLF